MPILRSPGSNLPRCASPAHTGPDASFPDVHALLGSRGCTGSLPDCVPGPVLSYERTSAGQQGNPQEAAGVLINSQIIWQGVGGYVWKSFVKIND